MDRKVQDVNFSSIRILAYRQIAPFRHSQLWAICVHNVEGNITLLRKSWYIAYRHLGKSLLETENDLETVL